MKVRRRILPIGGSKAVTLPARWVQAHGLKCGDEVEVAVNGHEVVVSANGLGWKGPGDVSECPRCGGSPVARERDRYGAYVRCPYCGWLESVGPQTDGVRTDTRLVRPHRAPGGGEEP